MLTYLAADPEANNVATETRLTKLHIRFMRKKCIDPYSVNTGSTIGPIC